MKTSRLLILVAALAVAGASYWLVRDGASRNADVTRIDTPAVPAGASGEPTREEVDAPALVATEPGPVQVASDSGRTEATVPQLELLLLDPEGRPVVDARIALFRGQELLAQGTTDPEGLASWPPQAGEAEYAIAALGWEIVRGEIEVSAGQRTITLVEGASIAGVALVDGAAAQPFELQWRSDAYAGQVALPLPVARALRRPQAKHLVTAALTEADGAFQFRGLRAEAKGKLHWTAPYFLRGEEDERSARGLRVEAPRSDLVLDLVEGIELRLRVVDPQGNAVPGAAVKLDRAVKLLSGRSRSWSTGNQVADAEGRFRQALSPEEFDQCTVSVSSPSNSAWKAHPLTRPPGLRGVWDVGDLATFEVRMLIVRVKDAEGAAIEGAIVYPWPSEGTRRESKTDPQGTVSMTIGETLTEFAVEAFTYTSALVPVPSDADEVTVTLQRSCTLEFELSDPARDREGLSLELSGPMPMFEPDQRTGADGSLERTPRPRMTEGLTSSSAGSGDRQAIIVHPAKDKRWRVSGILPHQSVHARLRGSGTLVCELDLPPLAPGEQRSVTLPVPAAARGLAVRVLSPELKPVPGAMISTESGDVVRMSTGQPVGANGELSFAWLHGERFDFVVTAKGFPAKRVRLSPIPEGRLDVVLDPPQSLEVELVQRDGTPYVGRVFFAADLPGARHVEPTKLSDGLYRLDAMPPGDVLLTINGDFTPVSRFHRAGDPRLRVVLGAPGSIEVTVSGTLADELAWLLEATPPGSPQGFARTGLEHAGTELPRATFHSMPSGEYDIWLVREESPFSMTYVRQGAPARVVLDAAHPSVKLDMEIPR